MRLGVISDTHGLLRPQVFDLFHFGDGQSGTDLADAITKVARLGQTQLSDFTMQSVRVLSIEQGYDDQHGRAMKGLAWVDSMELEILCCPSVDA